MKQFSIEVTYEGTARHYDIKSQGDRLYDISQENERIGTIELDGEDHESCTTVDCEIDLPLLNKIRDAISYHNTLNK